MKGLYQYIRCLLFLLFFFLTQSAGGQELLFENYSSEQGLSQNSCYAISQDGNGFMWFGTQDGLNRYDGKQFKVYLPQNSTGRKLPSNYISSLSFDKSRNLLWVGTIEGVCLYNPVMDSLLRISELFPYASRIEKVAVKKIVSFRENEYWFITFTNGLLFLNTRLGTLTSFFNNAKERNQVISLVQHEGKIIAGLLHQLFYLHPRGNSYNPEPLLPQYSFPEIRELYSYRGSLWIGTLATGCLLADNLFKPDASVQSFGINKGGIGCFLTDAQGNLWIGTRGDGIIRYNPNTRIIQTSTHNPYDDRSPGKNFVLSLFMDRQGIIWCGLSGSGLAKYDPLKYQIQSIRNEPTNPTSLPDNMIFDIYKCRDGTNYVGTQNKGITEWDINSNKFYPYPESSKFGPASNTIYDLAEDDEGNLWIASWGGLMHLDRKKKKIFADTEDTLLKAKKLYTLVKLKNADSLFITGENGPAFFSLKSRKWNPFSSNLLQENGIIGRYIFEDDKNILWICTVGAGLVRYDYQNHKFEIIEPVKKYSIYVRHLLREGPLFWLATDNGIVIYDYERNKIIKHITPNTSQSSNVCYALLKDNAGYFWVSTNTGIYKIDSKTWGIQKNYNMGNGLSFLEYNTACALKEADGSLLFGGVGGITRFNPAKLKENNFSPAPLITSININDESLQTTTAHSLISDLSFKHTQNFLTINFAVNNFSNQNNNQFSYRLKGLSNNWTPFNSQNFATYTSLPPGDYIFELRSANSDGKISEGMARLAFTIHPPWWRTWWFRLAVLSFLAGFFIFFTRRRIKVIRHEAALKQRIAETEMMALRAQMNPHFIFNSLNSIREMILNNENREASHFLSKFAQLIRITLDQSGQPFISLRNTLDYLHRYIEMEQVRNGEFTSRILADDDLDLDETILPPMLIQPFIENAIWHGVSSNHKNINIKIDFKKEGDQVVCIIEDNGVGIEKSKRNKNEVNNHHQPVGITNIQNRIRLLNEKHNLKSSLTIEDKSLIPGRHETGTLVTLRLPLEIKEE